MQEYLNKEIKEIINQFPEVGNILNEYNIGCVPCSVGTCLLKDIVEIHNLPGEEEQELMARIARVISPEGEREMPQVRGKPEITPKKITYSPPFKKLVDEHVLIKRWVALIPKIVNNLEKELEKDRQLILDGIEFIRFYADKYHHTKEEEILFKYFDENLDILKAMHEEHQQARSLVKAMYEALDRKDKAAVVKHLNTYAELLAEHIKKEDEILYPWMDRNLTLTQIGNLFSKFYEVEERIEYPPQKYEDFMNALEEEFSKKEVLP